ncbi:MAG: RNase adapter RapZ [Oscillospiraceae bacterium]
MQFVIVTGMSGSGKSSAIDVLEDIGYYCIDNMPPELITKFAGICRQMDEKIDKVAFVVDIRGGDFFLKLNDTIQSLRQENLKLKILYIDSSDETIIRRYKETRRKHPLDEISYGNIRRAIAYEREMLVNVKELADYYIDTTATPVTKLKERIYELFFDGEQDYMSINVVSFGFKYGSFSEGDLVFDVRCLPNPFYVPELKHKTGLDSEVSDYVMSFSDAQVLAKKLKDLLDFLIPLYVKEGKSQLVIAFGCTGGKHRSVTFAENTLHYLENKGYKVRVQHRDIDVH